MVNGPIAFLMIPVFLVIETHCPFVLYNNSQIEAHKACMLVPGTN